MFYKQYIPISIYIYMYLVLLALFSKLLQLCLVGQPSLLWWIWLPKTLVSLWGFLLGLPSPLLPAFGFCYWLTIRGIWLLPLAHYPWCLHVSAIVEISEQGIETESSGLGKSFARGLFYKWTYTYSFTQLFQPCSHVKRLPLD